MAADVSPLAGKTAPAVHAGERAAAGDGLFRRPARSGGAVAARRVRHLGASRLRLQQRLQRGAYPGDQPGDLRAPARKPASTGRSSSASTPMRWPSRPWRARSRCSRPTASSVMIDDSDGYTPTPVISHAILDLQQGPRQRASPTASSSRRRIIRPRMAASNTTRRMAGRPIPTSPTGSSAPPTRFSRTTFEGVRRMPYERARKSPPAFTATIMSAPMSPTSPMSSTWTRSAPRA